MVKPVDPSNPTGGDGNEKYNPPQKRGPSDFDKILEKEKAELAREEVRKMSEKTRAEPKYTGKAYSETGPKVGPTSGGFGGAGIPKVGPKKPYEFKSGGKVSSASARADGCCTKGKTKGKFV